MCECKKWIMEKILWNVEYKMNVSMIDFNDG